MISPPAPAHRPHRTVRTARTARTAWTAVVVVSALVIGACSAKDDASSDSADVTSAPVAETDAAATTDADPTTTAGAPDVATTTSLAADVTTTTSPVAASETTAPDVMRPPPFRTTIPGATIATIAETSTTESPTTVTPPVTDPATTLPSDGCVSCAPNFVFPYPTFFEVPQLGTEPVRGTGCGADGTLGEVIPDGIWDARSIKISASTIGIDVQCVYYGNSGAQLLANCLAEDPDGCENANPDFWFVNASSRIRTAPLAPSFRRRYATLECTDPGPGVTRGMDGQDDFDSWVIIEQGMATFALTSCIYG